MALIRPRLGRAEGVGHRQLVWLQRAVAPHARVVVASVRSLHQPDSDRGVLRVRPRRPNQDLSTVRRSATLPLAQSSSSRKCRTPRGSIYSGRVKVIARIEVGVETVDLKRATKLGLLVIDHPCYGVIEVARHADG